MKFRAQMKALAPQLTVPAGMLQKARPIAAQYTAVLEPYERGEFRGRTLELPYVMGFGKTVDACVENLREATAVVIASMLKMGETPPTPATRNKREDQVNIKLTHREKAFCTAAAKREGFRSVADFMRSLAMRRLR